jgi:malate dehydrogenase (oxaloacetate-decarboxylating)(NADP+)
MVNENDLHNGTLYPPMQNIRSVSLDIAVKVAEQAYAQGLAKEPRPDNLREFMAAKMYDPYY